MGDFLPWTLINRCAKFDAASFILSGEIRNRTNKQTNKKHANSKRYIHTLTIDMWIISKHGQPRKHVNCANATAAERQAFEITIYLQTVL